MTLHLIEYTHCFSNADHLFSEQNAYIAWVHALSKHCFYIYTYTITTKVIAQVIVHQQGMDGQQAVACDQPRLHG